ncbi:MAG TPA: hypothetical protein VFZ62_02655 [Candidatus Saccharimonadales bacterium]
MKNINIRKHYYHFKHRFLTMNNIVITVALVIGASWAWGSIEMMQRNYDLQKEVDTKYQQQRLAELQVATLEYEQNYYRSSEYQELAVRDKLNLADPGEKLLMLPPNSEQAKNAAKGFEKTAAEAAEPPSNLQQWTNFLFGGNHKDLQK